LFSLYRLRALHSVTVTCVLPLFCLFYAIPTHCSLGTFLRCSFYTDFIRIRYYRTDVRYTRSYDGTLSWRVTFLHLRLLFIHLLRSFVAVLRLFLHYRLPTCICSIGILRSTDHSIHYLPFLLHSFYILCSFSTTISFVDLFILEFGGISDTITLPLYNALFHRQFYHYNLFILPTYDH